MTTTAISEAWTQSDAAALNGHEKVIELGLESFARAGRAMLAISEGRLYRQTHTTFSAYCAERWGMSDRHVRRLMLAADVVAKMTELVGPMGPIPTTERQARELVGLAPAVAVVVMEQVVSDVAPVTAVAIADARRQVEKRKRKPLSDDIRKATYDLEKLTKRFRKIEQDDRFPQFAELLATNSWFTNAIDDLVRIRDAGRGDR